MRQIGTLTNRADARRFASYLVVQGIDAHSEEEGSEWAVWVRDEDKLDSARSALAEFRSDPSQAKFMGVEQTAEQLRREEASKREAARQNVVTMGQRWRRPGGGMRRPLTIIVILICGVIGVATNMGRNSSGTWMRALLFCDSSHAATGWQPATVEDKLIDIRRGQVWRILTPALVHYGAMHLAFNMVMFYQLASHIEHRKGSWALGGLMLAVAVPSNLAQALAPTELGGAALFAGLSGVVFGLLGYLWMKTRFDPGSGLYINRGTLLLAFVFLTLGFLGFLNTGETRMANLAHGVGFAAGIVIGLITAGGRTSAAGR
jgi:GlpG protein